MKKPARTVNHRAGMRTPFREMWVRRFVFVAPSQSSFCSLTTDIGLQSLLQPADQSPTQTRRANDDQEIDQPHQFNRFRHRLAWRSHRELQGVPRMFGVTGRNSTRPQGRK